MNLVIKFVLAGCFLPFVLSSSHAQTHAGQQAGKGAGTGALLGAVAGAVFGGGDPLEDALGGAAMGAGIGAIAGAIEGGGQDRREKEEFEKLVQTFGEDNLRGYVELIQCNHKKAIALFKVGQASEDDEHALVGFWLEAIAERDRRNKEQADRKLKDLVEMDRDIDDVEMAQVALNQYVLDLRNDRKVNQINCN